VSEPYLSLVVTARNDDHGGNLLGRMQTFVNNWLKQACRFQIPSELIIVEWNPPQDRPRLAEVLRWPAAPGPCEVRIIEVPPEAHHRLEHGKALPLYQMIAKNVGIRRARGKFVLATNIDIVFSSELAEFLAQQQLDPDRMYRIDRHDAMSDVPVDADPDTQLEYCRTHLIRINRREGTFSVDGDAKQQKETPSTRWLNLPGVRLSDGRFPIERHGQRESFRWAGERASIEIEQAPSRSHTLVVEIEPGPGFDGAAELQITGPGGFSSAVTLTGRCRLFVRADWGAVKRLEVRAVKPLSATARDSRALAFRVFRLAWKRYPLAGPKPGGASLHGLPLARRAEVLREGLRHLAERLAYDGPLVNLTVFVSPRLQKLLRVWARRAEDRTGEDKRKSVVVYPEFLHTNGCGDFTLLAREKWFDLRAYPEFDVFSMNLDSIFCFTAHHGGARELVLEDPMRIYHIEHGTGSGWTPEGQAKLFRRIEALGLSSLDNDTVMEWAQQMRRFDSPMIFNHDNWGYAADELRETVPVART
jgi:hypothetical protein